jgi:hypothetical protein
MCLRFVFLVMTRGAGWLRLSRRLETWKTAPAGLAAKTSPACSQPSPETCHDGTEPSRC